MVRFSRPLCPHLLPAPLTVFPTSKIPPLKTLTLKSRPLTTHAITFSCDAELAVAADDSVHVFLPEFPAPEEQNSSKPIPSTGGGTQDAVQTTTTTPGAPPAQDDNSSRQQYYTYILRIPTSRKPDPRMNASLFTAQGLAPPSYDDLDGEYAEDAASVFEGVGSGAVTGYGASLNQVVAVAWSPAGVGRNLRPVLSVMLTNGALLVLGEGNASSVDLGVRMRGFRDWRILWGVGANLPLPDVGSEDAAYLPRDKVRSFAWAERVETGQALVAYATDQEDVVVLSVQYYLSDEEDEEDEGAYVWRVEEVARFSGRGPHPNPSTTDPDYSPYTSAFSLKFSPWLLSENARTAVISYCARNYVGFRRITIPRAWDRGASIEASVEEADITGICTHLASDAFVEWENVVWDRDGAKVCRGVIASPFRAMPFQVALNGAEVAAKEEHDTDVCGTTYPEDTTSLDATNPISSLVIHPPDMTKRTKAPSYSLVRLSATGSNDNWFQQNAIDTYFDTLPKWAETISSTVKLSVPASMLGRGGVGRAAPGADAESVASDDDDSDDDDDDDFDLPEDAGEQIRPYRVRMWGLTTSPVGGVSAVLVSQHSTQQPEKTVKTRVMFGGKTALLAAAAGEDEMDVDGRGEPGPFWARQSTEAKMWDWMYGGGPPVPGTAGFEGDAASAGDVSMKERLGVVRSKQRCVFCQTGLKDRGKESVCERGHVFATCAATGLAILAPGISRACAVCGLRCLVAKEVEKIVREHLGPEAKIETSEEVCGGCGGKFVV